MMNTLQKRFTKDKKPTLNISTKRHGFFFISFELHRDNPFFMYTKYIVYTYNSNV